VPSLFAPKDRDALFRRIRALAPTSARRWGQMSTNAMLLHLGNSALMALGDLPVKPKNKRAFQRFPLKHLLLYVAPFPKGSPTARELLPVEPAEFEVERERLLALLTRLADGPREGMGPSHPLLGPLSRNEWGVLTHKHADHHLRQFGA
jgi:Protein of unknown function (DUF1569)